MRVTDRMKRAKRALEGVARGGTCPPRKILVSNLLRSLLVPFWVKQQELDDQLPI